MLKYRIFPIIGANNGKLQCEIERAKAYREDYKERNDIK